MRRALGWLRQRTEPRDVVMVLLVGACLAFTVHYVNASNRKFCQVITATTATPVQQPPDPKSNPSRENQWQWYVRFVSLGRSLGC